MRLDQETGYLSDLPYTPGAYGEQAPSFLNYICAINGARPPDLEGGFSYCELGCGLGVTLAALAAANPDGEFHGVDFNPGHIAEARRLAREGNLSNLHFHEATIGEALSRDMPEFDFVAVHGVLSWVPQDVRHEIVAFVQRKLKSGGVLFVSYNAMPGWAPLMPLRHLLAEYTASVSGSATVGIQAAAGWLKRLIDQDGGYVRANPYFKEFFGQLDGKPLAYLVHEYLHANWTPFWHSQVCEMFAPARVNFAGEAMVPSNYPELILTPAWREFIAGTGRAGSYQTQKDFLLNVQFRRDVFVKGAGSVEGPKRPGYLRDVRLARTSAPFADPFKFSAMNIESGSLHRQIAAAAEKKPLGYDDIAVLARDAGVDIGVAAGAAQILVAAGILAPARATSYSGSAGGKSSPLSAFNRAILARAMASRIPAYLASQVTGGIVALQPLDALMLERVGAGTRLDPAELQTALAALGLAVTEAGKAIEGDTAIRKKLVEKIEAFNAQLPHLVRLGAARPAQRAA